MVKCLNYLTNEFGLIYETNLHIYLHLYKIYILFISTIFLVHFCYLSFSYLFLGIVFVEFSFIYNIP